MHRKQCSLAKLPNLTDMSEEVGCSDYQLAMSVCLEPRFPLFNVPIRGKNAVIGCVAAVLDSGAQVPAIQEIFSAFRFLQRSYGSS